VIGQTTNERHGKPAALAEPTVHVRPAWIAGLSLASLGMWIATLTPLQVLLPLQLQNIAPEQKIVALGIVSAAGALSAVLATPLAGALSDRTTPAFAVGPLHGRRHRWTLGMVLLGAVSLVILAEQTTVAGVAIMWVLFNAFQNGQYASLNAAIPDHVPVHQRATVAGWVGMPQALGLVIGTILVVDVFTELLTGYIVLAILLVALALPFVFLTPDPPLKAEDQQQFSVNQLLRSYRISPQAHPDFGWAWVTRFLGFLAVSMGTLYLLYFLRDAVHYSREFPGETEADGLLILVEIYTACVVLAAIAGGIVSDWIGKER
jgi:MFS family permease